MPSILELGQKVKAKYPGTYDDLPDYEVGTKVKEKFPGSYDDYVDDQAKGASGFVVGAAKGIGETLQNIGNAALALPKKAIEMATPGGEIRTGVDPKSLVATTRSQKIGKTAERVAEFIAPAGKIAKATKGLSLIPRIAARAVPDAAISLAQTGGNAKSATAAGVTSAIGDALLGTPGKAVRGAMGAVRGIAKNSAAGYAADVSSGLAGDRGADRSGGKAFIPGGGTVIGTALGTASTAVRGAKNAFNKEFKTEKIVSKRASELDKLDRLQALKKAVEKGRERGIDVKKVLAETDVLHGAVDKSGNISTKGEGGPIEQYTRQFIDGNESIVSNVLKKEGVSISPALVQKKLEDAVRNAGIEGKALKQANASIADEIAGYQLRAGQNGAIPVSTLHDAKIDKYNSINFFTEGNAKKYDKTIAKALKELVEENTKSVNVKDINRELSKHFSVIDYLEKLDNKRVDGGKLGKYFARTVGAIVGSHSGPVGAIVGAELGGRVKGNMMSQAFKGKTNRTFPQAKAIEDAKSFMDAAPLRLPQSSPNIPGSRNASQQTTSIPINKGIDESIQGFPTSVNIPKGTSLDETRAIVNKHLETTLQALSDESTARLIESDKAGFFKQQIDDIAMGLRAENPKFGSVADRISKIRVGEIDDFQGLASEVRKALKSANLPTKGNGIRNIPNRQGGFISTGSTGLTTKILKDLEGKTTVSKQYILDATNRGELKQVERDITRQVLDTMPDGQINVKEFSDKVRSELLPLKRSVPSGVRYERIVLPDELRGNVKDYGEKIYSSPIKTSAGQTHFGGRMSEHLGSDNYFGHTRIEDMADNKTRRVIEVQSDLYQKGNLEKEGMGYKSVAEYNKDYPDQNFGKADRQKIKDMQKLQQYNDPTAHFRMIREEIQKAAKDGKTKLQFPTGETALKIEGLGEQNRWVVLGEKPNGDVLSTKLTPDELMVGKEIAEEYGDEWIITDVLGDGKFKAVPRDRVANKPGGLPYATPSFVAKDLPEVNGLKYDNQYVETFDISGKVDTNNPIYRFYEKDVQKYLNKYGGKRVVDDKGVEWIEVAIKDEYKGPVEAFGKVRVNPLMAGAAISGAGVLGLQALRSKNGSASETDEKGRNRSATRSAGLPKPREL